MKRRPLIVLGIACLWSVLMCIVLTMKAFERFKRPFPLWMTDAPRWYDDLLSAVMYAIVGVACLVHAYRRRHDLLKASDVKVKSFQRRWRDQMELRVVLYCLAALWALQLPLGALQSVQALHDHPPRGHSTLMSLFPIGGWVGPITAVAIVMLDRRLIRRDRKLIGACQTCGYDLRATPNRCPECGTESKASPNVMDANRDNVGRG
jgi:hypothetical protein